MANSLMKCVILTVLFCCFFKETEQNRSKLKALAHWYFDMLKEVKRRQKAANSPVKCRKEYLGKGNAAKLGYCWKFTPHNIRASVMERKCKQIGGHLVTVDTKEKAGWLAKYVKDMWLLANKGHFGAGVRSYYKKIYAKKGFAGMPNTIISMVQTSSDGKISKWTATNSTVHWQAYGDKPEKRRESGMHCAYFSLITEKWTFLTRCISGYKSVCEQNGTGITETTPRPTPKPTTTTTPKPTTTTPSPTQKDNYDDDYYYYYYD